MHFVSSRSSQRGIATLAQHAARLARKLGGTVRLFRLGVQEGMDLMSRYTSLARLSDAALAKRGLKREDVARAVLERPTLR